LFVQYKRFLDFPFGRRKWFIAFKIADIFGKKPVLLYQTNNIKINKQ
jgi:hypothetical protein